MSTEALLAVIIAAVVSLIIGMTAAYEGVTNDCKQLEKFRWAGVVYECHRIDGAAK